MEFSIPVFTQNENLDQFSSKWYGFVNQFNYYLDPSGQSKTSFLLHYGAQTMEEMRVSDDISNEDFPRFAACIENLEAQCLFQIVLCFTRHLFVTRCRKEETSMEDFYTELCLLSDCCNFDKHVREDLIKKQLINSIHDKSMKDLIIGVEGLSAKGVLSLCNFAQKQNTAVTADLIAPHLLELQQKMLINPVTEAEKDFGCAAIPSPETNETEIDLNSLFNNETSRAGDMKKAEPEYVVKMGANDIVHPNSNDNCSITGKVVSESSIFMDNCITVTSNSMVFPQTQPLMSDSCGDSGNDHYGSSGNNDENDIDNDNMLGAPNEGSNKNDGVRNVECCNDQDEANQIPVSSYLIGDGLSLQEIDANEIPAVFVSQQNAVLKTSKITEATGHYLEVYSCNFCTYTSTGKAAIEEHAQQVHDSLRLKCFVCTACNSKFPSKDQIDSHVRIQHLMIEEHKCEICNMVFTSQTKLFQHRQGHTKATAVPVPCSVCKAMFKTRKLLSDHLLISHPQWICRVCGAEFTDRRALSDHVSDSHDLVDCSDISDNIKEETSEVVHVRKICKLCDITFTDMKSFVSHRKKFHRVKNLRTFPCSMCDFRSKSKHGLAGHLKTHTGEKPHICEICGKGCAQKSSLDKHMRTHTGEKPYKCQYCGFAFKTSSNRLVHERDHRKERPYICEKCGRTFRNSYELKKHIVTHDEFRTKHFVCQ